MYQGISSTSVKITCEIADNFKTITRRQACQIGGSSPYPFTTATDEITKDIRSKAPYTWYVIFAHNIVLITRTELIVG